MLRQCDVQQNEIVIRGWFDEKVQIGDKVPTPLVGDWEVIRTHGYGLENLGIIELNPQQFKKR